MLALLIAMGGYFNDVYMRQTKMIGNHFPISIMGFVVLILVLVNPILGRIKTKWKFRPAELAVLIALPFATAVVPGCSFLRIFSHSLVMPAHYEKSIPSWQKNELMSYVPPAMLPADGKDTEAVLGNFISGMGRGNTHIGLRDVPWKYWRRTILFWIPLFLAIMFGLIGLSLVFHRQWSQHEHLVYPIAQFVQTLTGRDPHSGAAITRNRLFWYGLVPIFVLHLVNGLHTWFPSFIHIPTRIDISPLKELFPTITAAPHSGHLFIAPIYFTVVAFAYFLPTDITLSLGVSTAAGVLVSAALMQVGLVMRTSYVGAGDKNGILFGAYLGLSLLTIYSGRAYYKRVLAAACGLRRGADDIEASAVWGLRVFFLMMALGAAMMIGVGLPWPFAVLTLILLVILFSAVSRICAETGLFFVQPGWHASGVLLGLFGATAIGPKILMMLALISVVISLDPREAMMPFIVNALRISDDTGIKKGRIATIMGGMLTIGLLAGLVTVLWLQYDRGGVGLGTGRWQRERVPQAAFTFVDKQIQTLKADHTFEHARTLSLGARFLAIRPDKRYLTFLLSGLLLFASFSLLRIRFSKWPLHPVLFLAWMTWPGGMFSASFFIGWVVKVLVIRLGGGSTFQRIRPLMVGIIAGELLCGLLWMLVGAIYYSVTGLPPKRHLIFC